MSKVKVIHYDFQKQRCVNSKSTSKLAPEKDVKTHINFSEI